MSNFPSRFVDARNIDVCLPDGYHRAKRYRVLYMHDGQALFSGQWSISHQSWRLADTVATLQYLPQVARNAVICGTAYRIPHRIYMDHGTLGLDAYYAVHQQFFDLMMRDKGYTDLNYVSRIFR